MSDNLPPGVDNNHPIFDDGGPLYDVGELTEVLYGLEEFSDSLELALEILLDVCEISSEQAFQIRKTMESVFETLDEYKNKLDMEQ